MSRTPEPTGRGDPTEVHPSGMPRGKPGQLRTAGLCFSHLWNWGYLVTDRDFSVIIVILRHLGGFVHNVWLCRQTRFQGEYGTLVGPDVGPGSGEGNERIYKFDACAGGGGAGPLMTGEGACPLHDPHHWLHVTPPGAVLWSEGHVPRGPLKTNLKWLLQAPADPPSCPPQLHLCSWASLSRLPSLNSLLWAPRHCFSTTIAGLAQEKVPRKASGDSSREQCVPPHIQRLNH